MEIFLTVNGVSLHTVRALDKREYLVIIRDIQSTLVISKSKGPSKKLRDIRTSTYQMCSSEEKTIRTTKIYK